jgi:hypothetical protein
MPTIPSRLHYPPDIDEAYEAWGASCGPCSLSAILGCTVADVKPFMEGIERRGYTNVTHMKAALETAGVRYQSLGPKLPTRGLCFVQWSGHDHKPIRVQYQFTHWFSIEDGWVFEVNAPNLVTWEQWQRMMPKLMEEAGRGTGGYRIRSGLALCRG